jgi:hypothetical protein
MQCFEDVIGIQFLLHLTDESGGAV